MFKKILRLIIVFLISISFFSFNYVNADDIKIYYLNITTGNEEILMNDLSTLINKNVNNQTYAQLWYDFSLTDINPETGKIWDMYSNYQYTYSTQQGSSSSTEGRYYNREHVVPQSWFNEALPMKADLFHVYPTDVYVNNRRSNYPYGEVSTATYTSQNGCKLGSSSSSLYNGTVFEIIDEYKGDIARTYFYMATRYKNKIEGWTNDSKVIFKSTFPYLTDYAIDLFVRWSLEDPVSEKEVARNNAIYSIQRNRNPYIDHPEYITLIWGSGENDIDYGTIGTIVDEINLLPNIIKLTDEENVNTMLSLYNSLNAAEKILVTNYYKLENAVSVIEYYKNVKNPDDGLEKISTKEFTLPSANMSYTTNYSFNMNDLPFTATSACVNSGIFRLGGNSPGPYSLEMCFDVKNLSKVKIVVSKSYSNFSGYSFSYSTDKGVNWTNMRKVDITSADESTVIECIIAPPMSSRVRFTIYGDKP